jgi:hypothetical protein
MRFKADLKISLSPSLFLLHLAGASDEFPHIFARMSQFMLSKVCYRSQETLLAP